MSDSSFTFKAKLWMYQGKGAWFFVTLPKEQSERIRFLSGRKRRGWGSLRVTARIGKAVWKTSLFPDSKAGAYLLPIKAEVREAEGIKAGASIAVRIALDTVS